MRANSIEKHIVIVEDDGAMLDLMRDFLSCDGYKISCYFSPLDALDELLKHSRQGFSPADLIITDVLMNPIHGPEFLERVKAVYPDIPFIMISAFGETLKNKIEIEGTRNGTFTFLHKPFSIVEFKQLVHKELNLPRFV